MTPDDSEAALPSPQLAAPRSGAWTTVAILTLLYWLGTLDRQIAALLVPQIKTDLSLTDFQVSLIQGLAFGGMYMLASPLVGWLVDAWSRRWLLLAGVGGWSVSASLSGLATSFGQLFAARAGVGGLEATINPIAYSLISDMFPPRKLALPISIYVLGGNLGSGVSFLAGGAVMAWLAASPLPALPFVGHLASWQMAFLITGLPGLILAPLALFMRDPARSGATGKPASGYGELFRHVRRNWGFYLAHNLGFAVIMAFVVGLQSWNAAYIVRAFHWKLSSVGFAIGSAQLLASISGLAVHGWLVDRWYASGRHDAHLRYFTIMSLLALPCAVGAYLVPNAIAMLVLYNLSYFFVMAFASIGPAALQIATPGHLRGKASSIYMIMLTILGSILGPMFVAAITDFGFGDEARLGHSLAVFGGTACLLAAILFTLGQAPMRRLAKG